MRGWGSAAAAGRAGIGRGAFAGRTRHTTPQQRGAGVRALQMVLRRLRLHSTAAVRALQRGLSRQGLPVMSPYLQLRPLGSQGDLLKSAGPCCCMHPHQSQLHRQARHTRQALRPSWHVEARLLQP